MKRQQPKPLPLLEFIRALTPRYTKPRHLAPLTKQLEIAETEPIQLVVSTPPRHAKTETLSHYVAWRLKRDPGLQVAYVSYSATIAEKKARKIRDLAVAAGVPISDDASSRKDWRTGVRDGGVWACGVEGGITGEGFDLMIVDDPVKDRATAESALARQTTAEWFNDTAFTRLEPRGSCIVNMARWHQDDLAGRLIESGWDNLVLPAINSAGEALWPERWPVDKLRKIETQLGQYGFRSLYQGDPMPRGGHVFGDVVFYDVLPPKFSITIGVDLAYSEKTHADYSVAVVMGHHGKDSYILDVVRVQEKAPQFRTRLASLKARWPGASWCAYLGGTEKGVADLFHQFGVDLGARRPRGDKFVRAQPVAAAWNAGRILLPRKALWLNPVVDEIKNFTGVKDPHDDVIDALAASYDAARPEREHTVNSDTVRAILQSQFRNSVPRVSPVAGLPGAEAMHEGPQRWGGAGLSAYLANTVGPY